MASTFDMFDLTGFLPLLSALFSDRRSEYTSLYLLRVVMPCWMLSNWRFRMCKGICLFLSIIFPLYSPICNEYCRLLYVHLESAHVMRTAS